MSLIVLYFGFRYDVCEGNSLRDMTISPFLWPLTFACDLYRPPRPLSFLSWTLCCCALISDTKFIGFIKFEIWTFVWRKLKWRHNDVITHAIFMNFNDKSTKGVHQVKGFHKVPRWQQRLLFFSNRQNLNKSQSWILRIVKCSKDPESN